MDDWACVRCTLKNTSTMSSCEACGAPSPSNACKNDEMLARALSNELNSNPDDEIAKDLDPWSQAEMEWAEVEATQNDRKRK